MSKCQDCKCGQVIPQRDWINGFPEVQDSNDIRYCVTFNGNDLTQRQRETLTEALKDRELSGMPIAEFSASREAEYEEVYNE